MIRSGMVELQWRHYLFRTDHAFERAWWPWPLHPIKGKLQVFKFKKTPQRRDHHPF